MGDSGGKEQKCQISGILPLPSQGPHLPHSEMWLSKVPGSTPQAQMSLDVQTGALPQCCSSLLSLPPAHQRPPRKPSRMARRDSWDGTGWAQWPPVLQKMKH